jgi:hypothetical protein
MPGELVMNRQTWKIPEKRWGDIIRPRRKRQTFEAIIHLCFKKGVIQLNRGCNNYCNQYWIIYNIANPSGRGE